MNNKPCNCIFCVQFYFNRINNYKFNKNNKLYEQDNFKKLINAEKIVNNKTFTISDLEKIRTLKSLGLSTNDISKQINLSHSIVEYIIKIIHQ